MQDDPAALALHPGEAIRRELVDGGGGAVVALDQTQEAAPVAVVCNKFFPTRDKLVHWVVLEDVFIYKDYF